MQPRHYSIPEPCSEDWNKMTPTEQGAFCAKCTKEVLDCSSIKSSEIKPLIESAKDPCVRIYNSQIDEMNFMEWFYSLSLRKQLKYIFLFAFIMVFSLNGKAQDSPELIQPQFVEIDSTDEVTQEELNDDYETISEIQSLSTETLPDSVYWSRQISKFEIIGGTIMVGMIGPPIDFPKPGEYELISECSINFEVEEIATIASNYVTVDNNNYSFLIEEDILEFHINARKETSIQIKIRKKETKETVYFNPIHVDEGQKRILFPLDDFENGAYIIIVEGTVEKKAIELMYW